MGSKTGIFGGSFNPVHIGHLALANYLCEYEGIDELWFMVSPQNPFKKDSRLLDDHARLALVRAAIQGYPRFKASDFEFRLPRPSYTVHTLQALHEAFPQRSFCLIMGSDNWLRFPEWKSPERILALCSILIYPRKGFPVNEAALPANVRMSHAAPQMEISSTFIREAIREGKDVRFFLPEAIRHEAVRLYGKG